jgi:uncharacterized membrane protein
VLALVLQWVLVQALTAMAAAALPCVTVAYVTLTVAYVTLVVAYVTVMVAYVTRVAVTRWGCSSPWAMRSGAAVTGGGGQTGRRG